MFTDEQTAIIKSTAELIGRAGATQFEIGWEHDDVPIELMGWYCEAKWGPKKLRVKGKGPVEAAEALAKQILDGGLCVHCQREVTIDDVGDTTKCFRSRIDDHWYRGCEIDHPDDGERPTRHKLVTALIRVGAPNNMLEAAAKGYFDEYESDLAFPLMKLVEDCMKLYTQTGNKGFLDVAEQTKNGDFDASKEEAARYWESDEGMETMEEFGDEAKALFMKMQQSRQAEEQPPPTGNRAERRRAERDAKKRKR